MILVTGGTGLLGSHLLLLLLQKGCKIRALYRQKSDRATVLNLFSFYDENGKNLYDKIEWVLGDIMDIPSLTVAMDGVDVVYHCAGLVSFDPKEEEKLYEINVEGTANVVNLCLSNKVHKLCHVSSTAATGYAEKDILIDEDMTWINKNNSYYALSKYNGELEVWRGMEEGLHAVIVNPCIIVGAGDWSRSSLLLFKTLKNGLRYYPTGSNAFVSAGDVAKAMYLLTEGDYEYNRYLVIGENMSYREMLTLSAKTLHVTAPRKKVTSTALSIAVTYYKLRRLFTGRKPLVTAESGRSSTLNVCYSNEKIKKEIGISFTPLRQTLSLLAQFSEQNPKV